VGGIRDALTLTGMNVHEAAVEPAEVEEDFGAELSDDELGDLLVREITIDGMCGVY
jgi:mycofactocin precursor